MAVSAGAISLAAWADAAGHLGLCALRPAVACLLLPVLAPEVVPPMVRNGLFLCLGALSLALQPEIAWPALSGYVWLRVAATEAVLGLLMGLGLGSFLWAFTAAGEIVDAKVGQNQLQLHDPAAGMASGPSGTLLGRLAGCAFLATGGLGAFVRVLVDSFRVWPIGQAVWQPWPAGLAVVEAWWADGAARALLLASPALVVLFAVDLALGLVNRWAPQMPLIALSGSLKACAAVAVWLLMLATIGHGFEEALHERIGSLLPLMQRAGASGG